jgi:hypothetical protein
VRDEYAGAHDAEERGDCFQHGDDPNNPAAGPNCMQRCTVKGISFDAEFCKAADVLMQQIGSADGRLGFARARNR